MVDVSAIAGALSALKSSKDIAEAMIGIRDAVTMNEHRLELQSKLGDAQTSIFAVNEERATLLETVSRLEKQITSMETWEAEKQRYALDNAAVGAFVYALKEPMSGGEPPHWLCAECYGNRKKSILQVFERTKGYGMGSSDHLWKCPHCQSTVRTEFAVRPGFSAPPSPAGTPRNDTVWTKG